jgi:transposase InsO family protein
MRSILIKKIVHLYCDNGREYLSGEMREFCKQKEITYLTVPNTPQQNSVTERMNRILTEKVNQC